MLMSDFQFLAVLFILLAIYAKPSGGIRLLDRFGKPLTLLCLVMAVLCYGLWHWR